MMTFYIVGVVIVLLVTLTQVSYELAYQKEDRMSWGTIGILAFFSWLTLFTIIMTAMFSIAKKNRKDK